MTIPNANLTQVLQAVTPGKAAEKIQNTKLGVALVSLGVAAAAVSFLMMLRMVWTGAEITLLGLIFAGVPLVVGMVLLVMGAHQWSGELVTAAIKDVLSLFGGVSKLWRRNGNGGGV